MSLPAFLPVFLVLRLNHHAAIFARNLFFMSGSGCARDAPELFFALNEDAIIRENGDAAEGFEFVHSALLVRGAGSSFFLGDVLAERPVLRGRGVRVAATTVASPTGGSADASAYSGASASAFQKSATDLRVAPRLMWVTLAISLRNKMLCAFSGIVSCCSFRQSARGLRLRSRPLRRSKAKKRRPRGF